MQNKTQKRTFSSPQSICLLRFSAIGDVCHTVAAVQAIQKQHPKAKITWVIGRTEHQLLEGLKGVEFIIFDKKLGLNAFKQLKRDLNSRQFDVLLHMQTSIRASLATLLIKAKTKLGFHPKRSRELQWLFCNRYTAFNGEYHVADTLMSFARALGVNSSQPLSWQMPQDKEAKAWFKQLSIDSPYIVISPSASNSERNWLAERYAALADHAIKKGFAVVLCSSPHIKETQLVAEIEHYCSHEIINLSGQTNLKQLLEVLKNAALVIAPDSGPVHMAVSVNTPVIGLYAHSNPARTGPYTCLDFMVSRYHQSVKAQSGKTSDQHGWGYRARGAGLMATIELNDVIQTFDKLLSTLDCQLSDNLTRLKSTAI
jgi:heptosyltransferase I